MSKKVSENEESPTIYNFDGFIIEVLSPTKNELGDNTSKKPKWSDNAASNKNTKAVSSMCSICSNLIQPNDEIAIEKCEHKFCRVCLIDFVIQNENEIIKCPSRVSVCSTQISSEEIKNLIGFEPTRVARRTTESQLFPKDATGTLIPSKTIELASLKSTKSANLSALPVDFFISDQQREHLLDSSVSLSPQKSGTRQMAALDENFNFTTGNKENMAKQTTSRAEPISDVNALGAAGLWGRQLHSSFQGQPSPVIRREILTSTLTASRPSQNPPLLLNDEPFVCSICESFVLEQQGVVLKKCNHNFCRDCLSSVIEGTRSIPVTCPMKYEKCGKEITEEEIRALLTPGKFKLFKQKCEEILLSFTHKDFMSIGTVPALLDLENMDYVENKVKFDCEICLSTIEPGLGIILKNCLHEYCKPCLAKTIETSDDLEIRCPYVSDGGFHCEGVLQDLELRSLITPEVYGDLLAKSLAHAEATNKNSFHCKTPDCPGWAEVVTARKFHCIICFKTNCITCKAIHEGKTCEEYFYDNNAGARKDRDDKLTEAQVQQLIQSRQAMLCPGCNAVIQKTTGCNHMICSRCKRDFQWLGQQ